MSPPLLFLSGTELGFGGELLLDGVDVTVERRARICLVGRNGSGKSTLLKIAAGLVEADAGQRFVQPGVTLRYLPQEPDLRKFSSVRAYVESGLEPDDQNHRIESVLQSLRIEANADPQKISGGERRRAALAKVLAPEPDILLLDEPTNHLDLPAIEWLESELIKSRSAIVLISHDRRFLETLSHAVIWLDRGRARHLNSSFHGFESWRDVIIEQEEVQLQKLDRSINSENHWLHRGVTARRKRNMGRLRALQRMRHDRQNQRQQIGSVKIKVSKIKRSATRMLEVINISKNYGEKLIVDNFSMRIRRGARIGIVGPNGAGKTTLMRMLVGELEPDGGIVEIGPNVQMATLEQTRLTLKPEVTLRDALTGGNGDSVTIGGEQRHVIGYMKDFLFVPEQANTPVSALSGGERGRLMLARALARPANLLVLDEPTNDLDLETLDLLQEFLANYDGTVILVSHDRDFLDRVATSVILAEGQGKWVKYAGGFSDMLSQSNYNAKAVALLKPENRLQKSKNAGEPKRKVAKLSYKDKRALETLPEAITEMEFKISQLETVIADQDLYARDPNGFATTSEQLAAAQRELSQAEDEWLRIESLREDLRNSE